MHSELNNLKWCNASCSGTAEYIILADFTLHDVSTRSSEWYQTWGGIDTGVRVEHLFLWLTLITIPLARASSCQFQKKQTVLPSRCVCNHFYKMFHRISAPTIKGSDVNSWIPQFSGCGTSRVVCCASSIQICIWFEVLTDPSIICACHDGLIDIEIVPCKGMTSWPTLHVWPCSWLCRLSFTSMTE